MSALDSQQLRKQLHGLLHSLCSSDGPLPEALAGQLERLQVSRPKNPEHGDYSTNLALIAAKPLGADARSLGRSVAEALNAHAPDWLERAEVAGGGFINLHLQEGVQHRVIGEVLMQGERYGCRVQERPERIQVEFVSANPTGPLHVGHGRGAAYGDALVRVLEAAGHRIEREYYVNDAGRQMQILTLSVWLRYLQQRRPDIPYPKQIYQGDYILEIAERARETFADALECETAPAAIPEKDEAALDALIVQAQALLPERWEALHQLALEWMLDNIRADLAELQVGFDRWFCESEITEADLDTVLEKLADAGALHEAEDGALWFRSSRYGDEKDRVLRRSDGRFTYFGVDIAYHCGKFERGYDRVIEVWGADHHGYIPRMRSALGVLGIDPGRIEFHLVQFATLYRDGEKVKMSTRAAEYVPLAVLRDEIGADACRYFYTAVGSDRHLEFDLTTATSQSKENPVYYVQYAHARICSLFRHIGVDAPDPQADLSLLSGEAEQRLMALLGTYPELIDSMARERRIHRLAHYLGDLARVFHGWYDSHRFRDDETALRDARLALCGAVRQVLANALGILGVSAPESM